ncbi:MAG: hypothetical protein LBK99_21790 [Opitutaceae bacterium]|nr:hypothetical protein [Opitutaceae bacterium]
MSAEKAGELVDKISREERKRVKAMLPALMRQPGARFNPFEADQDS